jgi:hypothetical protein
MLREAHQQGVRAALATFGVKEAANWLPTLTGARKVLIGESPEILSALRNKGLSEGLRGLFQPGNTLHHGNVWWPTIKNAPVRTWLGRGFGTILPAYGAIQAVRGKSGDPNEGRLTNVLSALGSAAGFAYGAPSLGMLGAPLLARAGHGVGQRLGRMLGSRATPPQPEYAPPQEAAPAEPYYPGPGPYAGGF